MKKSIILVMFLILTIIALIVYNSTKLPDGINPKSGDIAVNIISLLTAIVSLIGTLVTLVLKIIEQKGTKEIKGN